MIPVSYLESRVQGVKQPDTSIPSIKLGASLSRKTSDPGKTKTNRKWSTATEKVILARRVSGSLAGLVSQKQQQQVKGREGGRTRKRLKDMYLSGHLQELSATQCFEKFKRIARVVRVVVRIMLMLKKYLMEEKNPNWSLVELTLNLQDYFDKILSFRPLRGWKSHHNHRLETVLSVPPRFRSSEHIRVMRALLRSHAAFEDYPEHIQIQLCQVMLYQRYESRRVILRKGHVGCAFYMIASGSVLVNLHEVHETTGQPFTRTVNELGPGEAFGEISLITGERRSATIVCKVDTELLMVEKKDFDEIIKKPLEKQRDRHMAFCQTMELFKYFPCEELLQQPGSFFYQYFKKNTVVLKDSADSNYIVVLMTGKCRAVAEFDEYDETAKKKNMTKAASKSHKQLEQKFPLLADKQKREKQNWQKRSVLPERISRQSVQFNLSSLQKKIRPSQQPLQRLTLDFRKLTQPRRRRSSLTDFFELVERENKSAEAELKQPFWARRLSQFDKLPKIDFPGQERLNSLEDQFFDKETRLSQQVKAKETVKKGIGRTQRRASMLASSLSTRQGVTQVMDENGDALKKYAQLAEFTAGSVFGLESLLQKIPLKICLLSDGAECIFISKKVFLEHANAKVLRVVSDLLVMYPSREYIGQYIQEQKKWKAYKASLAQKSK